MPGKFLYIEDHEDAVKLICRVFDNAEIVWVSNRHDALPLLFNGQKFDVILIDHYLPDTTGLDLCREIRTRDDHTPIVFVTASSSLSIHEVRQAGGQGLIRKASPNFVIQLRQTVNDLTGCSSKNA